MDRAFIYFVQCPGNRSLQLCSSEFALHQRVREDAMRTLLFENVSESDMVLLVEPWGVREMVSEGQKVLIEFEEEAEYQHEVSVLPANTILIGVYGKNIKITKGDITVMDTF